MTITKNMEVLVKVPFNMEVPLVLVNLRNISWATNQAEKSGLHAAKPILKPIISKSQRNGIDHGAWMVIRITEKHRSYIYCVKYLKDLFFIVPFSSEWARYDNSHPEFITLLISVMNSGWEMSFQAHSDEHGMTKYMSLRYLSPSLAPKKVCFWPADLTGPRNRHFLILLIIKQCAIHYCYNF